MQFVQPSSQQKYKIYHKADSSAVVLLKIAFLTNFQEKLLKKKVFFLLLANKIIVLVLKAKYQTQVLE